MKEYAVAPIHTSGVALRHVVPPGCTLCPALDLDINPPEPGCPPLPAIESNALLRGSIRGRWLSQGLRSLAEPCLTQRALPTGRFRQQRREHQVHDQDRSHEGMETAGGGGAVVVAPPHELQPPGESPLPPP